MVTLVRRDNFEKTTVKEDKVITRIQKLFEEIFHNLRIKSKKVMDEILAEAENMDELEEHIEQRKIVKVNWCGDPECASNIKDIVTGEIRGTKWDIEEDPTGVCILCGDEGKYIAYVSRTY
jgi:prolyl-tRNA synthetase